MLGTKKMPNIHNKNSFLSLLNYPFGMEWFNTSVSVPVGSVSLAGSGSTSGNVDPDPGSKKKIVIKSHTNQQKIIRI